MNKAEFTDALKYGACTGCENATGHKEHVCPERSKDYGCNETCNCCELCTRICEWESQTK